MSPIPPAVQTKPYMTYIPGRHPLWKTHSNVGQAKNAILYRMTYGSHKYATCDMQVHVWQNEEWVLLWDIPRATPYSELPWINTAEVKAKEEVEQHKKTLEILQRVFVGKHDLDKLSQVWDAKATEPLEDQLDFNPSDYI